MDMNKFAVDVAEKVQQIMGDDYVANVTEKKLVNGGTEKQITVGRKDSNVRPSINLAQVIMQEADVEEVAGRVIEIFKEHETDTLRTEMLSDRDYILKNCYIQLMNKERNKAMQEEAVHEDFLDLIAVVRCSVEIPNQGRGSYIVKNCLAEKAGIDTALLLETAKKNMADSFNFRGMSEVMYEMMGASSPFAQEGGSGEELLYVGSNKGKMYGASIMLYSEKFQELADRLGDDLYVIPSSIHECIALPVGGKDKEMVAEMIPMVNSTEVAENEVLSDTLYYFDRETGELKVA